MATLFIISPVLCVLAILSFSASVLYDSKKGYLADRLTYISLMLITISALLISFVPTAFLLPCF
jgi:hypothetical protein